MPLLEAVFVIGLGIMVGLSLVNTVKNAQQQRQLDDAFYRLLDVQNGRIALIQLAVTARVEASLAHQYLEQQAKAFAAIPEVDADGDTFYRFPKLRHPGQGS